MRPETATALEAWESAHAKQQDAAVTALRAAFPPLNAPEKPGTCCPVTMRWDKAPGWGKVCVENDCHASMEFTDLPKRILGAAADSIFRDSWTDQELVGLGEAEPGTYYWNDEEGGSEIEVTIRADEKADIAFGYATVPDVTTLLDALFTAFDE
jgi:hypothetical protein